MKCVCVFFINIKISASIGSATTILNWERIDFFSACKHIHNTFNCRAFCNAINNYTLKPINWSFSVEWVSKLRKKWRIRQCIWSGQFIKLLILRKWGKKRAEVDVYFVTCWWNARLMFRYKTNICRTLHMIYFKPCSFLELSKPFSYRIVSQERSFRTHSWKRLWLLIFNIAFRCLKSAKKMKFLKITPHSNTIHSIHHKSNLFISFSNPNQFTS